MIPEHLIKYSPTSAFKVYRKTQYIIISVSLVTGILFFLGANLIANKVFSKPHLSFYFALAACFVVFQSMTKLNTEAVRGLRLIKVFAVMLVLPQSFNLMFMATLWLLGPNKDVPVYAVLGGFTMTGIIGWIIMESAFKKRMGPNDTLHNMSGRNILSISLPMLMTTTMGFLIAQTGVVMLGMFRSEAEIGYYAIAVKLANLTAFVLQAINSMAGPKFSELFHSDKLDELFYVAKKSAKLIFFTTTPILAGLLVLGKPLLRIVFGHDFVVAYPALALLALGQFANCISGSSGMFLNMTGNQNVFKNIMIITAGLNISLNLLLVPRLGINGAAISAAVSLSFWNIASLVYMKIKFGKTTGYFPISMKNILP
jgi:O-antigen/teichoic acid export membrane protein